MEEKFQQEVSSNGCSMDCARLRLTTHGAKMNIVIVILKIPKNLKAYKLKTPIYHFLCSQYCQGRLPPPSPAHTIDSALIMCLSAPCLRRAEPNVKNRRRRRVRKARLIGRACRGFRVLPRQKRDDVSKAFLSLPIWHNGSPDPPKRLLGLFSLHNFQSRPSSAKKVDYLFFCFFFRLLQGGQEEGRR